MSELTRSAALKRLVGMAVMPVAMPCHEDKEIRLELQDVYRNMIWAFAPLLSSARPGKMLDPAPFEETQRRLGTLAAKLDGPDV